MIFFNFFRTHPIIEKIKVRLRISTFKSRHIFLHLLGLRVQRTNSIDKDDDILL